MTPHVGPAYQVQDYALEDARGVSGENIDDDIFMPVQSSGESAQASKNQQNRDQDPECGLLEAMYVVAGSNNCYHACEKKGDIQQPARCFNYVFEDKGGRGGARTMASNPELMPPFLVLFCPVGRPFFHKARASDVGDKGKWPRHPYEGQKDDSVHQYVLFRERSLKEVSRKVPLLVFW